MAKSLYIRRHLPGAAAQLQQLKHALLPSSGAGAPFDAGMDAAAVLALSAQRTARALQAGGGIPAGGDLAGMAVALEQAAEAAVQATKVIYQEASGKWVLRSKKKGKDGKYKILGRHDSRASAERQERAIEANKASKTGKSD